MQRLKQSNSGAVLPLNDSELLSASTTQTLPGNAWCHVRMRLAANGEAERSVHLYDGPGHSAFHHEAIVLADGVVDQIVTAVRAAFVERALVPEDEDDSQALYRTLVFREGREDPRVLGVEYQHDKPVGPAGAFEDAWRLLAAQFPATRPDRQIVAGLAW